MSRRLLPSLVAAAASLILAAPRAHAGGGPGSGTPITAVWRATMSCQGITVQNLQRDPAAEAIARERLVGLPQQHLQFLVPALPGLSKVVVRLAFDDRSRGVLDQYVLMAGSDLAPPMAAVVVTDLPRGLESPAQVFDSVATLERKLAQGTGAYPAFTRVDGPYGEALEMSVPGRATSPCFPTSGFVTAGRTDDMVPFEISRFALASGRLVEFAMVLSMPAAMTLEDQQTRAKSAMDDFWGGLSAF
jgi:hypothetical protein